METRRYKLVEPVIDAVQLTKENMMEVADWIGGAFTHRPNEEMVSKGKLTAGLGDWVVKTTYFDEANFWTNRVDISVYPLNHFDKKFKEAK